MSHDLNARTSNPEPNAYPALPAFDYAAFPPLAIAEQAMAARRSSGDPIPSEESLRDTIFGRIAAAMARFVLALRGVNSSQRRKTGAYQVLTHGESYDFPRGHELTPMLAPKLTTIEVIGPAIPTDPRYRILIEAALPTRTLGLGLELPPPTIASRRYRPEWPEPLRDAYRATLAAAAAWMAATDGSFTARPSIVYGRAETITFRAWQELETQYRPAFLEWEAANGVDPLEPVTLPLDAVESRAL